MTYALDTNIISYYLRGDKTIRGKFRTITINKDTLVIPPIVYYEVKRSFHLNPAPTKEKVFNQMCANYSVGILCRRCLENAAKLYADLRAYNPEDADLLIAAFCIVNNYTLVTNNEKHFKNITGLVFENWVIEDGA